MVQSGKAIYMFDFANNAGGAIGGLLMWGVVLVAVLALAFMAIRDPYQRLGVIGVLGFYTFAIVFTIIIPGMQIAALQPSEVAKAKIANYYGDKRINDSFSLSDPFLSGNDAPTVIGKGKTIFIREGCWHCHTLMPENTQDWAYFGAPPTANDFVGENPTVVGSDRKAPDLLHIGARMPSYEWHVQHLTAPRSVSEGSIMPNMDFLGGAPVASLGKNSAERANALMAKLGENPDYLKGTDMDALAQFLLSLK